MDVGVRELKAHLSEYLERAAKGETITITDRGRPTAVLAPLPGRSRIDQGIAEGWITAPTVQGLLPSVRRHRPVRNIDEVLLEDRGE
jgi:prevent-host-death family protein